MSYITDYQYYENNKTVPTDENWGSYQYVSLDDIVNNFMLIMKEIKILQLQICDQLRFVLPPDYVNWVRISLYKDGVLMPLTENIQTNWSDAYLQDHKCRVLFDAFGAVLKPESSKLDIDRITKQKRSIYLNEGSPYNGLMGYFFEGNWYFDYNVGGRFGLNTETANSNPTFSINKRGGVINFSSGVAGELVVLEYVSDGMEKGNDSKVSVNKLFEDYIYAAIKYSLLNNRLSAQEYVINRARKDKSSLLRNAKLRLSNMHPGRLLMNLRGQAKWIKLYADTN